MGGLMGTGNLGMRVDELGMGPSNEANIVIITPVPFLSLNCQ